MRSLGSATTAAQWRRIALILGVPGLPVVLVALLVGATLMLFGLGSAGALAARDTMSRSAVRSAGVPDADLAVYQAAGARLNIPWQLLARQRAGPSRAYGRRVRRAVPDQVGHSRHHGG